MSNKRSESATYELYLDLVEDRKSKGLTCDVRTLCELLSASPNTIVKFAKRRLEDELASSPDLPPDFLNASKRMVQSAVEVTRQASAEKLRLLEEAVESDEVRFQQLEEKLIAAEDIAQRKTHEAIVQTGAADELRKQLDKLIPRLNYLESIELFANRTKSSYEQLQADYKDLLGRLNEETERRRQAESRAAAAEGLLGKVKVMQEDGRE